LNLTRTEQAMSIETHQIAPNNINRAITQLERAMVPESSSAK